MTDIGPPHVSRTATAPARRWLLLLPLLASAGPIQAATAERPAVPSVAPGQVLHTAQAVRQLTPAEAGRSHPVRLRAVVTSVGRQMNGYFVLDDSGPIFIARGATAGMPGSAPSLEVGQVVEIEGITREGSYAPQVLEQRRTLLARTTLPPPEQLNFEQISSGRKDCHYAEIEGIVRAVTEEGLTLAMGEGRVDVACSALPGEALQTLIDARVRLRGVVSGRFNQKRQWVAARFNLSIPDGIIVERAAPVDPYSARAYSIAELLQWEMNQKGRHRVKIRGIVTHFQAGVALFVREGNTGLQVRTHETEPLVPGDVVEVLGFPALGTYSAELEDAVYRKVDREDAPLPVAAPTDELLAGTYDANLVSVRGVLLESVRRSDAEILVMQSGDIVFDAELRSGLPGRAMLPAPGSELDLSGICVVAETFINGARLSPRMFSLLLRSPADVRVVHGPPWWNQARLWQALGVISLAVLGILSWVWLLRRQVRAQTDALKEQTQREAVLEERTRIAQELHDTLDQDLTGITLQLNAAVTQLKDDAVAPRLELVRRLLRRSQSEVQRSVWDLRRPALEPGGLVAALEATAAQLRSDSTALFDVTVTGEARPLPALVEHHLLRIAAEAITNAFKHAAAQHIAVEVFHAAESVRLRVTDDGCGFAADQAPGHATGHFGLIGMRERTRKVGGVFNLTSAPGEGTRIEVRIPLLHDHGSAAVAPFTIPHHSHGTQEHR